MNDKRLYLDSLTANSGLTHEALDTLIKQGYTIVTANAVDNNPFQMNQVWLEEHLIAGNIRIELWHTPDEMVRKAFFWSSCSMETSPAATLEDAIENLPNAADILDVADLVDAYGIPKGQWTMGPAVKSAPLSTVLAVKLGLDPTKATRTDVLAAAKKADMMAEFDAYNAAYNHAIAVQHCCSGIINSDGTVTEF